jgi:hypothetical protein
LVLTFQFFILHNASSTHTTHNRNRSPQETRRIQNRYQITASQTVLENRPVQKYRNRRSPANRSITSEQFTALGDPHETPEGKIQEKQPDTG